MSASLRRRLLDLEGGYRPRPRFRPGRNPDPELVGPPVVRAWLKTLSIETLEELEEAVSHIEAGGTAEELPSPLRERYRDLDVEYQRFAGEWQA